MGVIRFMGVMADITIFLSKKFHDWLKDKGKKDQTYEYIIKDFSLWGLPCPIGFFLTSYNK